jgi:hypothetical protein
MFFPLYIEVPPKLEAQEEIGLLPENTRQDKIGEK